MEEIVSTRTVLVFLTVSTWAPDVCPSETLCQARLLGEMSTVTKPLKWTPQPTVVREISVKHAARRASRHRGNGAVGDEIAVVSDAGASELPCLIRRCHLFVPDLSGIFGESPRLAASLSFTDEIADGEPDTLARECACSLYRLG